MEKNKTKRIKILAACVAALIVIALGFVPEQTFKGKVVNAVDNVGYQGMSREAYVWDKNHPKDKTAWTGSMFSGMPTMIITGNTEKDLTRPVFKTIIQQDRTPASTLIISLLGAFLLMLSLGVDPILAVGGAVAITFCSYNLQIIQVGHNTKIRALAFAPWVLAALVFTFKKALDTSATGWRKWLPQTLLGAVLFGLALAFQIKANHVQITWYLALIVICFAIGQIVWLCVSKERLKSLWGRFLTASAILLFTGAAGIATNACELVPMWEYTSYTNRGGSELSDGNKDGLSIKYSTTWSYGWEELPNLIIPNFNGGATSGSLSEKSKVAGLVKKSNAANYRQQLKNQPTYWGPQPSTAGPMYVGVITVFLFILGLFLADGKNKWWMLAVAILSIILALGSNLMAFTRFFHDHVPFYNKFRAVSMSLVILQIVLPMLAFITLDKIMKGDVEKNRFKKVCSGVFAVIGGFCLIFTLFPGMAGDFKSSLDSSLSDLYVKALTHDRKALLQKDALLSLIFVSASFLALLWAYRKNAVNKDKIIASVAICALVLVNMLGVGNRYLNSSHFKNPRDYHNTFAPTPVEKKLTEDKNPSFRIADLTTLNTFNDSRMSYYNKSIGGYSAAKLQRYDDLIKHYLKNELKILSDVVISSSTFIDYLNNLKEVQIPILDMLNTKYFIFNYDRPPLTNPRAMGNAWFVNNSVVANSPDEELSLIGQYDLHTTAVLGPDFKDIEIPTTNNENDWISLVSYAPNELKYQYHASYKRAAVLSEIYYPIGWTAKLDDEKELDIFRVDWTLRGLILPRGTHTITMRMDPPSYKTGSNISMASSILLYLLLVLSVGGLLITSKKKR